MFFSEVPLPRVRCLSLLGLSANMEQVKQIHGQMITSKLLRDPRVVGMLIEAYSNHHLPQGAAHARLVFRHRDMIGADFLWNTMIRCSHTPEEALMLYKEAFLTSQPRVLVDSFTYTLVLQACARRLHNGLQQGSQVHAHILKTGFASNGAVQTTAIHLYATCKDIKSARIMFDGMSLRSSVTWNAMLTAYCINGCPWEALGLFHDMLREGVRPTDRTATMLLSACSQIGDLSIARSVHAFICKSIPSSHQDDCVYIGTGLVDMYSKCGCLSSASSLFQRMKHRNVVAWSVMIGALAFHGRGKAAIEMLDEMQKMGVAPNALTVTSLLSGCCHAGIVEEGLQLFDAMKSRFGITPSMQHYSCIVDLLGRSGMVEEAYGVVRSMPIEPDPIVWRALLGACNLHGYVQLGQEVGRILLTAPTTTEDLVALSNVYASTQRWDDVSTLRETIKGMALPNKPGTTSLSCRFRTISSVV